MQLTPFFPGRKPKKKSAGTFTSASFIIGIVFLLWMLPGTVYGNDAWPLADWPDDDDKPVPEAYVPASQAEELTLQVKTLADELIKNLEMSDPGKSLLDNGLLACTFVDLKKLYRTSTFGRYLSEQLMNEFQKRGYRVVEMRKSTKVLVQERHGEYGLSRDPEEISATIAVGAMLTGTYVLAEDQIVVNARLLDNTDASLLSSATILFPRNSLSNHLLADASTAAPKLPEVMYMKKLVR